LRTPSVTDATNAGDAISTLFQPLRTVVDNTLDFFAAQAVGRLKRAYACNDFRLNVLFLLHQASEPLKSGSSQFRAACFSLEKVIAALGF